MSHSKGNRQNIKEGPNLPDINWNMKHNATLFNNNSLEVVKQ